MLPGKRGDCTIFVIKMVLHTLRPKQKWPPFYRWHFHQHCYEWKKFYILIKISLKFFPQVSHWQYSISQEICTRFLLCCALLWLYIDWFSPYPSGLLHWHCGNLTIAPVPAKQPWWIWINSSCEFIMNDCITTTKQSTTKPCAYVLGYTVCQHQDVFTYIKQLHRHRV